MLSGNVMAFCGQMNSGGMDEQCDNGDGRGEPGHKVLWLCSDAEGYVALNFMRISPSG